MDLHAPLSLGSAMLHPSSSQVIELYERHASEWEADRCHGVFAERAWLDRWLDLIPAGRRVLDIGCGFGWPVADYLVSRGLLVTGIDSSLAVIERCRESFPDQQWHIADMRTLDLQGTFDGILAWDSFFHLAGTDQQSIFPNFRKHAAPGCALFFTSVPKEGEAIGQLHGETLYHASLAPDPYRGLLNAIGFVVRAGRVEDPACGRHTVWLAQRDSGEQISS
jgi:SAM-dependent methyltransferase